MAFQNVNVSNTKKATGMAVGETLTGYVVRTEPSTKVEDGINIIMRDKETGEDYVFFPAGNIKYMLKDGKIGTGLLTQITRLEQKVIKGKTSSNFEVMQDPDDTLESASFAALGGAPASGDIKEGPRKAIQGRAAKLAADAGRTA